MTVEEKELLKRFIKCFQGLSDSDQEKAVIFIEGMAFKAKEGETCKQA